MALGTGVGVRAGAGRKAAASGFDPLSLSPALWLKADAGTFQTVAGSPAVADGDPVGEWQDQSGNSRHMAQATGAARPTLKLNVKNSLPGILFDGTDDLLANASAFLTGTAGMVLAVVTHQTGGRNVLASADVSTATSYMVCRVISEKVETAQQNAGDTPDRLIGGTTLVTATSYLLDWRSNGTVTAIGVNGADETLNVNSGANNGDWFGDTTLRDNTTVGAWTRSTGTDDFYKGHIHELLVYDADVSAGNRALLREYLRARWAVY